MTAGGASRDARASDGHVVDLEVVEDRTAGSRADEGFLRVRRLVLRSVFADGRRSAPYPCDIVSRARTDAVAIVLYEVEEGDAAADLSPASVRLPGRRSVRVALRRAVRAPVFLRRHATHTQPDSRRWDRVAEIVAGLLEPQDVGPAGIARRAAAEASEEAGVALDVGDVVPLGAESFPSPGITDEKVHFRAAAVDLDARGEPTGDGSAMEEGGDVVLMSIEDAIEACRRGEIPDMKTEIALLRLCDHIGYVPSLSLFVDDLPADLRASWRPLGVEGAR